MGCNPTGFTLIEPILKTYQRATYFPDVPSDASSQEFEYLWLDMAGMRKDFSLEANEQHHVK